MSQLIDLGKLRFHFAGQWSNATTYESNDIVKYGGNVYVYTFALKTAGVLPTDTAYWALMVEGFNFTGVFSTSGNYKIGDGVAHGGVVYVAVKDSVNITPPNATYWSRFLDGIQYEGVYSATTSYQKNDVVKYGGSIFVAKQDGTNNLPTNTVYWDKFVEGVSPSGIYNEATAYKPNDLVAYGANIYRAKVETTNNAPSNTGFWELYVGGIKFNGNFSAVTEYYVNDIVVYGNNIYRSKLTQSNTLPTVAANWELLTAGNSYKGNYVNATGYFQGDIVSYGGNVYIALGVTTGNLPTDATKWQIYSSGFSFQGTWSSAISYKINEVIGYGGSLYRAKSDNQNVNPTVTATWDKIVAGFKVSGPWSTTTQYATDEVVTYGGNTYISILPHASTVFDTDLAANKWQKFNSGIRWMGPWVSTTQYYKDDVVKAGASSFIANEDSLGGSNPAGGTNTKWSSFATGAEGFLSKDGDAMLGMLTLFAVPTDPLHAATKSYVDRFINATSGGTILGPLVASGAAASYTATGGATVNISAGSLNLTNGSTLTTDGTSTLGNTRVSGTLDVDGDLNVDGGDLTVSGTTFNLANTTVTTVNLAGAATAVNVGAATGTTTVKNNLVVDGDTQIKGGDLTTNQTTFNVINTTATTVNAFNAATNLNIAGAGTAIEIGAATGLTSINNNVTIDGVLDVISGTTITNTTDDPTGFDNQHPDTRGVVEYSDNGTRVYVIDKNGDVTVRENSQFATGTAYQTAAVAKTLAIYPVAGQTKFVYYINGVRYEKTGLVSSTLTTINGYNYFYFNGGTLTNSTTRTDEILTTKANVAAVRGTSRNNRSISVEDQRHGISIDGASLTYIKRAEGIKLVSGHGITPGTVGAGTYTNTKAGELRDADLTITSPVKTSNKFVVRDGNDWKLADNDDNLLSYKLGVLGSVTVTAQGSGYSGLSTTLSVQGDGQGAVVTPVLAGAPLQTITLNNGGFNYANNSTVTLLGDGTGGTATIVVPAGKNIGSVAITDQGSRYTTAPTATVVGGGGTGATVSIALNLGTPIAAVHMDALGSGYTTASAIISGDGTGATATVTIVAGAVTDINLTNPGNGYTYATVTITGNGSGATATVHTLKNYIQAYEITNVGSGYTSNPTVTINGDGHEATATATITAGGVTDIVITNGGHGYTFATMTISGGGGSGATANPILSGYPLNSITLTNRGKNYTSTPTINIVGNQYSQGGTASVILAQGNTIDSITLTNPGVNYTYATVQVNSSTAGTSANFTVAATPSGILGVTVVNGGRHYSYANIIATDTGGATGFAATTTLTPVPQYNGYVNQSTGYDLNNIPAGKFTNTYFVAVSSADRVVKVPSAYLFNSIREAFQYAKKEVKELQDYGMPFANYKFLGVSVIDNSGQLVTIPGTNLGDVLYYDLLNNDNNSAPLNADGTKVGRSLTIAASGNAAAWLGATESSKVYYVAPHGVDQVTSGSNMATPFASIKYACQRAEEGSTIFVKTGAYSEQLPIIVPANVAIVGDNQRTVNVEPKVGLSDDGVTPNNQSTMFRLSNGSILNKMTFRGMTGWVPGSVPGDITTSTIKGVVVGFNPASPITHKSPYVLECSFIGSGAIGALIDGTVHSTGAKTMIFHGYTIITDNGVGYWVKDEGKAEIVSCFTYYNYFGYVATGGGFIRALNGNNSYGTWGAVSQGFGISETPITGALLGRQLNFVYQGGSINVGDTASSIGATPAPAVTYAVTVANPGSGNVYVIDAVNNPVLTLTRGGVYTFNLSNASNTGHPLAFKDSNGTIYTQGVVTTGTPGTAGAQVVFTVPNNAPAGLRYYCTVHGESMGNTITATGLGAFDGLLVTGTGIVTNVQYSANKVYLRNTTGTFGFGSALKFTSGGVGTTSAGTLEDQKGFVLVMNGLTALPKPGQSIQIAGDTVAYVIQSVTGTYSSTASEIVVVLAQEKPMGSPTGTAVSLRSKYSQIRLTGHDFLSIGTGGTVTTNYPGEPTQLAAQGNETQEVYPGRVYYVSTDQDGNFRVGEYFRIDQATGRATLNANAFDLAGLTSLKLGSIGAQLGETINEFSSDGTMSGNSNTAVPTEQAVRTYTDASIAKNELTPATRSYTYNPTTKLLTTAVEGNSTLSNITYNSKGQIASYTEALVSGGVTFSKNIVLTYNSAGRVTGVAVT